MLPRRTTETTFIDTHISFPNIRQLFECTRRKTRQGGMRHAKLAAGMPLLGCDFADARRLGDGQDGLVRPVGELAWIDARFTRQSSLPTEHHGGHCFGGTPSIDRLVFAIVSHCIHPPICPLYIASANLGLHDGHLRP